MTSERVIGVDVSASKIKAAVLDPLSGELVGQPERAEMPRLAPPDDVAAVVARVAGTLPSTE